MNRKNRSVSTPWLAMVLGCGIALGAYAQEPVNARQPPPEMDSRTRDVLFGKALQPNKAESTPISTVEQLAANVSEVRIFLTDVQDTVIGEVVVEGRTRLSVFAATMEKGTVRFLDDGEAPDRKRGDGVFTASFNMDTRAAFKQQQESLRSFVGAQGSKAGTAFVRRGPRDIVPVSELNARSLNLDISRARGANVLRATDPLAAAKLMKIGLRETPFLTFPVEQGDPRTLRRPMRLFEIPFLPRFPFPTPPIPIDKSKSLMIVHTGVVDDGARTFDACTNTGTAGGVWSFGHLVREMAQGTGMTPEDFLMHWLASWSIAQEANGFIVNEPGRGAQMQARVVASWTQLSGGALNVDKFPARLMAIVNRPDLADKIGYGSAGSAGEGRFVFGIVEKNGAACNSMPFTVIFEYGIKGGSCGAVKAWHQRWKALDAFTPGTSDYNSALALITSEFTERGANPAQIPNQNALNQLRTNEIPLGGIWQLREFRLQGTTGSVPPGFLDLVTVKQTPADSFNNSPVLSAYLQSESGNILADKHIVPDRFPSVLNPFLGASSDAPSPSFFWNTNLAALGPDAREIRRKFSLGTCNGCHAGETNTFFTHIGSVGTRNPGSEAVLSGFLTGITVPDPSGGGATHIYNDLAEREAKMSRILTRSCFELLAERRIPFEH